MSVLISKTKKSVATRLGERIRTQTAKVGIIGLGHDPFYLNWLARRQGMSTRYIELAGEINT